MPEREILRVAFLQDYTGRPETLAELLDEVKAKGYRHIALSAKHETLPVFRDLCARGHALGLGVCVFTGYMKYQHKYLTEHPEQRMMAPCADEDQDGLSASSWGCPFNPDFKARYVDMLREIAACPGVDSIWLNDEASLNLGCCCPICRAAYAREIGGEIPLKANPRQADWSDPAWRRYLRWKLDRWSAVHGEMADAIHAVAPHVRASFQASPHSDLVRNPWYAAIDLAGMIERLDGLSSDPYYTFHTHPYHPPEAYLGEWCRFLAGLATGDKRAEVIPQGFAHATFTRPLGREDGYWSALIPPACGVDFVAPYTYTLQRITPAQETYERCFAFDGYFERTTPLKYAAAVHGFKTECFRRPFPRGAEGSYDGTRLRPVTESLRHRGAPYAILPDARLSDPDALDAYDVLVLPEIGCVSDAEADGLRRFLESGGRAIILGELGAADELGEPRAKPLLEELTGARILSGPEGEREFRVAEDCPAVDAIRQVDPEPAHVYMQGIMAPLWGLSHCVTAEAPAGARVLAEFVDADGGPTGQPAILSLRDDDSLLWFAGFPTLNFPNKRYDSVVQNVAHKLFAALAEVAAGGPPALRVEGWPLRTPIEQLRPVDRRLQSTFEFFPLEGDDVWLGLVTSYFKELADFPMVFEIPPGRSLRRVVELLSGREIEAEVEDGAARVRVELGFDTPALLYGFELG